MLCNLQIFSGCVCPLEQLHAQSPFLFPIVFSINLIPFFDISSVLAVHSPGLFGYVLLYFTWATARSQELLFVVLACHALRALDSRCMLRTRRRVCICIGSTRCRGNHMHDHSRFQRDSDDVTGVSLSLSLLLTKVTHAQYRKRFRASYNIVIIWHTKKDSQDGEVCASGGDEKRTPESSRTQLSAKILRMHVLEQWYCNQWDQDDLHKIFPITCWLYLTLAAVQDVSRSASWSSFQKLVFLPTITSYYRLKIDSGGGI